jgi:hypothetical protein
MRDDRDVPRPRGPSFGDAQRFKEARVEDSSCDHGRADYEKAADRESKPELSSIVSDVTRGRE